MGMNKTQKALKLALVALEYIDLQDNDRDFLSPEECCDLDDAITAIREALAEQPAQQEPVAQHRNLHNHMMIVGSRAFDAVTNNGRRPASRKQIVREICKAIQSDKNLLAKLSPQPAQQPVAWMDAEGDVYKTEPPEGWFPPHTPLYTSPQPAQPSKPLTQDELRHMYQNSTAWQFYCDVDERLFGRPDHGIKGDA